MNKRRILALAVVLAAALLLTACLKPETKVTRENYDKLTLGMTYPSVVETLGQPTDTGSQFGIRYFTWVDGERQIHAKFIADRAVYYSSKGLKDDIPKE